MAIKPQNDKILPSFLHGFLTQKLKNIAILLMALSPTASTSSSHELFKIDIPT